MKNPQVGDRVIYLPYAGAEESGVITKINERYVFVQFDGDNHSKACTSDRLNREEEGNE